MKTYGLINITTATRKNFPVKTFSMLLFSFVLCGAVSAQSPQKATETKIKMTHAPVATKEVKLDTVSAKVTANPAATYTAGKPTAVKSADKPASKTTQNEVVVNADPPFVKVEIMPKFNGGDLKRFHEWVQDKLKAKGVKGRTAVQFVIEKDGTISNISVLDKTDSDGAQEAVKILRQSPLWTPGQQNNTPVRVQHTMVVGFL